MSVNVKLHVARAYDPISCSLCSVFCRSVDVSEILYRRATSSIMCLRLRLSVQETFFNRTLAQLCIHWIGIVCVLDASLDLASDRNIISVDNALLPLHHCRVRPDLLRKRNELAWRSA
jgi:hypothetical protein